VNWLSLLASLHQLKVFEGWLITYNPLTTKESIMRSCLKILMIGIIWRSSINKMHSLRRFWIWCFLRLRIVYNFWVDWNKECNNGTRVWPLNFQICLSNIWVPKITLCAHWSGMKGSCYNRLIWFSYLNWLMGEIMVF